MSTPGAEAEPRGPTTDRVRVAYVVGRLPKVTETFVLNEIVAVTGYGVPLGLYALRRSTLAMPPDFASRVPPVQTRPFLSAAVLRANARFWRDDPRTYAKAFGELVRGTWGSSSYFRGALRYFLRSVLFAAEMVANGVTHVHAHFASRPTAVAFVIHRLTGIPFSFTAHGSDIHRDRTMLAEKVAEARFVVAVSRFNRDVILDACDGRFREKVLVIRCGVDTDRFQPGATAGLKGMPGPAPFRVVCVGRLLAVKGQRFLLEACRLLRARGLPLECHLVGDGPERAALQERARAAGLTGLVRFCGWQTHAEVAALLRTADVVVAPSAPSADGRLEGIPVALMEAMATGVPVVASRLAGIPELVEHGVTGRLAPPADPVALAAELERLWRDPAEREQLGLAGRRKVKREFRHPTNAAVLAALFVDGTAARKEAQGS